MAECPQFQMLPQVVPIYQPQQPPPPLPTTFPMPGQPIYPMLSHFGYPPMAWSPIPNPYPQPGFCHAEEEDDYNAQHVYDNNNTSISNNNSYGVEDSENEQSQRLNKPPVFPRSVPPKFDTRHEEFRKYLEEMGILSTFTNILSEMYKDPLRPNDPMGYIRDKLNCARPDTIELSNLRIWCAQYQAKTLRLEKELKHVIERLKKHEPYNTDDSLFNESSSDSDCKSCVLGISKQGHMLGNKKENVNYESIKNNYVLKKK